MFLVVSGASKAELVSARELLTWCADGSPAGTAACSAYIAGIADAVTDPSAMSCSAKASRSEVRKAVVKEMFSLQSQALLDFPAVASVTLALRTVYPCK